MKTFYHRISILFLLVFIAGACAAQTPDNDSIHVVYPDGSESVVTSPSSRRSRLTPSDSYADTLGAASAGVNERGKSPAKKEKVRKKRDWTTWRPNAKRALWLALVIPGGGQIYNRKFWKLPIFYGGFVGCIYAMTWNNQMYHDYAQAYMDIMDNNPNTHSYDEFLHFGSTVTDANRSRYQELFRKRKNRYRRWRDLATFVTIGVYALSVIDAYVDASLSDFDISKDLSLHVAPAVISGKPLAGTSSIQNTGIGLGATLTF